MSRPASFFVPAAILGLWAIITAAYLYGAFVLAWAVLVGTTVAFGCTLIGLERSQDRKHDMDSMCYMLLVMLVMAALI